LDKARAGGNTIGRHLIQSFAPGEVNAEQAHKIGKKLAAEILGGQYAYVMTTHVDRDHVHNHFVWCAVNINTHNRYVSNKGSYRRIQDASDKLCAEYSLSVITEKSGRRGKGYTEYQAEKRGTSWKSQLRRTIGAAIISSNTFDAFLTFMQDAGYEIKHGQYISFRAVGQERFTRAKTIGDDYTEERIRERIFGTKPYPQQSKETVRQVIDIEGNKKIKSSIGYMKWAKLENLKINAKTLIYLQEHGMADLSEFNNRYQSCMGTFYAARGSLKTTEDRIKALKELQTQLRNYGRTKENYKRFQASKDKDKFLRKNPGVEGDVMIHEAAKRHFKKYTDAHGKPLPKMTDIVAELQSLQTAKTQQRSEYQTAKAEHDIMIKLKVNLQSVLGKNAVREYSGREVSL